MSEIKELLYISKCVFVIFVVICLKYITNGYENKLKQKGKNNLSFLKNHLSQELTMSKSYLGARKLYFINTRITFF